MFRDVPECYGMFHVPGFVRAYLVVYGVKEWSAAI